MTIILKDGEESIDNEQVFVSDDLTWLDLNRAIGVRESAYITMSVVKKKSPMLLFQVLEEEIKRIK